MFSKRYITSFLFLTLLCITIDLYAQEEVLPKIDLNGKYRATSWVYSHLGERIDREQNLDLTITYRKKRLSLDSITYIVDNAVHLVPNSSADQYKAFWTDDGNQLVLEKYVAEDGVFRKGVDDKPVKIVSSFYYSPDKKNLIWETLFPGEMTVKRTYSKLTSP